MRKLLMILVLIGMIFGGIGCLTEEEVEKFEITKMTDFANMNDDTKVVIDGEEYDVVIGESVICDYNEYEGEFVANLKGRNELYKVRDNENNVTIYYTVNEYNMNDIGISAIKD